MWNLLIVLADGGAAKPQGPGFEVIVFPLLLIGLFYLIVLRPAQRRQQQERDALLTGLKKGDEVITTAGIYGTVISVSDNKDEVTVKVDDGTRLRMIKSSILRNMTNEEAAKAAKENPKKETQ